MIMCLPLTVLFGSAAWIAHKVVVTRPRRTSDSGLVSFFEGRTYSLIARGLGLLSAAAAVALWWFSGPVMEGPKALMPVAIVVSGLQLFYSGSLVEREANKRRRLEKEREAEEALRRGEGLG